jgi:hypothetical protein
VRKVPLKIAREVTANRATSPQWDRCAESKSFPHRRAHGEVLILITQLQIDANIRRRLPPSGLGARSRNHNRRKYNIQICAHF